MSESRKIVLWRHGQTTWNVERRFQGATDIPLDETGHAQAVRSARLLAALGPAAIVSSPLRRAADTARALAAVTRLAVTFDPDLSERGGGAFEGLTSSEIQERYPVENAAWQPPGGETVEEVSKRVAAAIERGLDLIPSAGLLVIASHGAALRLGMLGWLGFPEDLWSRFGGLSNCCWSVLEEGRRGWRLVEHNAGTLPEPVLSDDRAENDG